MLMSQTAYAKTINRSKQYVNKLVKDGVIVLQERKVSKSQADTAINNIKDPSRDAQREANEKRRDSLFTDDNLPENSMADMSEDEKREYNNRLFEEQEKLKQAKESAISAGVNIGKEAMPTSLNKVKIFRELYMGKIAQLDFKKKSGEVVDKSDVESDGFEAGRIIRDHFMGMAVRVSPYLARVNNVAEIEKLLEEEIIKILENISA